MFLLVQVGDLLYLFFLMFLSEKIFEASRVNLRGIVFMFFILKSELLYFYINEKKYTIKVFILLRTCLLIFPFLYFLSNCWNVSTIIHTGKIFLILFFVILIYNFITIYKALRFKIWRIILVILYLIISYFLLICMMVSIGEG